MTAVRKPDARLAASLGHEFQDPALLERALMHPSVANEIDGSGGNERLEYLGDAVLDLVIGRLLFDAHPDWREGSLTRARASMVNQASLAARARDLALGDYIRLGKTELRSGGADKDRVLANLFEAVVGALYLDAGLDRVFEFTRRAFAKPLASGEVVLARDPKTRFQEWAHADRRETPTYRELEDTGEEAADDRFRIAVELSGESWGTGSGRTKRSAERAAARAALERAGQGDG